jgi:hypothetical protein
VAGTVATTCVAVFEVTVSVVVPSTTVGLAVPNAVPWIVITVPAVLTDTLVIVCATAMCGARNSRPLATSKQWERNTVKLIGHPLPNAVRTNDRLSPGDEGARCGRNGNKTGLG